MLAGVPRVTHPKVGGYGTGQFCKLIAGLVLFVLPWLRIFFDCSLSTPMYFSAVRGKFGLCSLQSSFVVCGSPRLGFSRLTDGPTLDGNLISGGSSDSTRHSLAEPISRVRCTKCWSGFKVFLSPNYNKQFVFKLNHIRMRVLTSRTPVMGIIECNCR